MPNPHTFTGDPKKWHSLTSGYNVFGQKKVPIDWEINDIFVSSLDPQETDYGYEVYNL